MWPDGARYEGFWRYNKACGKGKFWHVDGDVFEGEWQDDKANGYGVYVHMNGARYEGYWKDDFTSEEARNFFIKFFPEIPHIPDIY